MHFYIALICFTIVFSNMVGVVLADELAHALIFKGIYNLDLMGGAYGKYGNIFISGIVSMIGVIIFDSMFQGTYYYILKANIGTFIINTIGTDFLRIEPIYEKSQHVETVEQVPLLKSSNSIEEQ